MSNETINQVVNNQVEERDPLKRVARFKDVPSNWMAWEDCDIPGNFRGLQRYMGPVASISQLGKAPIEGDNFSIGLVCCPPGNGPELHDHTTEEVFFVLEGEFEVTWGDEGENRMTVGKWDCVSMPTQMMRSFKNIGTDFGYMMAIIAGEAAPVTWKKNEYNDREIK